MQGADLEKSKLELDKIMPLTAPVPAAQAVEEKVRSKIDACTPEALVFYSCNPNYDKAESLWNSVAVTFLEWSTDVRLFCCVLLGGGFLFFANALAGGAGVQADSSVSLSLSARLGRGAGPGAAVSARLEPPARRGRQVRRVRRSVDAVFRAGGRRRLCGGPARARARAVAAPRQDGAAAPPPPQRERAARAVPRRLRPAHRAQSAQTLEGTVPAVLVFLSPGSPSL